ncbi:MAG: hypothetical protein GC159_17700 [Phycisphaera sp.]|nr:hypothetical protein [Phycisphaera sp.]
MLGRCGPGRSPCVCFSFGGVVMHVKIPLSKLVASRKNPRRVKPMREAHRRLVASIRTHGPMGTLTVLPEQDGKHKVIAGCRRLAAMREVYRHADDDPLIHCEVREVDGVGAEGIALAENFAREPMHPLDEAEAFARLAHVDAKGVSAIASQFGVEPKYVRQRMKLAGLAEPIKQAYRADAIDTGAAEAFATVSVEKQLELWSEIDGPRNAGRCDAQRVRAMIEHDWIEATHALFDIETLPHQAVSRDLFCERVLIERAAFFEAQAETLAERQAELLDDGWNDVVIAPRGDVYDRLMRMDRLEGEMDDASRARQAEFDQRRRQLEAKLEHVDEDDEQAADAIYEQLDALDAQEIQLERAATRTYSEADKAHGTVFFVLDPDGGVQTLYRSPRRSVSRAGGGIPRLPNPSPAWGAGRNCLPTR